MPDIDTAAAQVFGMRHERLANALSQLFGTCCILQGGESQPIIWFARKMGQ